MEPVTMAISAAKDISFGLFSAHNQARLAGQQIEQAALQAQAGVAVQNMQAMQQWNTANSQAALQRNQFVEQQQQSVKQLFDQQMFQMQQNRLQMEQQARFQAQNQQLQITQQNAAQRFQQEQQARTTNLQIEQMNNQLLRSYGQQREAVIAERFQIMKKHEIDRNVYQASRNSASEQRRLNNEAAGRAYTAEQMKLDGKRKEAAFEAQSILAKSIGAKGSIYASGRVGTSIGLLVNDVERQAGFQRAQEAAMLEADKAAALIGMEDIYYQNQADNIKTADQVPFYPSMPYLPKLPEVPNFVGLEIPT